MLGTVVTWNVQHVDMPRFREMADRLGLRASHYQRLLARKSAEARVRKLREMSRVGRYVLDGDVVLWHDGRRAAVAGRVLEDGQLQLEGSFALEAAAVNVSLEVHSTVISALVRDYIERLRALRLRQHGGVYFVSHRLIGYLERLEQTLLEFQAGSLRRFDVEHLGEDDTHGIAQALRDRLRALLGELRSVGDAREETRARHLERVQRELSILSALFQDIMEVARSEEQQLRKTLAEVARTLPPSVFRAALETEASFKPDLERQLML